MRGGTMKRAVVATLFVTLCTGVTASEVPAPYLVRTLSGDAHGDEFGASVAFIKDVDGDGCKDVLVGAPRGMVDGERRGYVRLFSGLTGTEIRTHVGANPGDEFGSAVTHTFEFFKNWPRYAVTAPGAGTVTVFTKKGKQHQVFSVDAPPDARFGQAITPFLWYQRQAFAVGAPFDDAAGDDAGSVSVFVEGDHEVTLYGAAAGARFGSALEWSSSFGGLLVGAPGMGMVQNVGLDGNVYAEISGSAHGAAPGFGSAIAEMVFKYDQIQTIVTTLGIGAAGDTVTSGTSTVLSGPFTFSGSRFRAVAGQTVSLYASALSSAQGPLLASLIRPDGTPFPALDTFQPWWSEPDDLVFQSVPIDQTGTWTFVGQPGSPSGKLHLSSWPVFPMSGGVIVVD